MAPAVRAAEETHLGRVRAAEETHLGRVRAAEETHLGRVRAAEETHLGRVRAAELKHLGWGSDPQGPPLDRAHPHDRLRASEWRCITHQ